MTKWGALTGGLFLLLLSLGVAVAAAAPFPWFVPAPADRTSSRAFGDIPALPDTLPVAEPVRDPLFAVLVGLVEADLYGVLTRERLEREIAAIGRNTKLPLEHLREIRRDPREGPARATIRLVGSEPIDLPVPYRILLYHPGSFRASAETHLTEWHLGDLRLDRGRQDDGKLAPLVELNDVRLWGIHRGEVEIDVDGWLDGLMGSKLDDTRVVGFALFRYQGERIGMAVGYNPSGRGRSGTFSFREDKILFPNPAELKSAGAYLRGRLERLMPSVRDARPD